MRDVLTDALARHAQPGDLEELARLDSQWKAMKTVEPLAWKAGATGNISGPAMMAPVGRAYKNAAYDGAGNMASIAKVGSLLKPPADSGTASNELANHLLGAVGGAGMAMVGGGAGEVALGGLGALAGAAAALPANRIYNALMRAPINTTRAINAGLNGGPRLPGVNQNLLAQALLAQAGLSQGRGQLTTTGTPSP